MSYKKYFQDSLVKYSTIRVLNNRFKPIYHEININKKIIDDLPFNKQLPNVNEAVDSKGNPEINEIINYILPPRQYYDPESKVYYIQHVSLTPSTRYEVNELRQKFKQSLEKSNAREIGLCEYRRKIYSECFDEIIRQITIECAERGLVLAEIKNEINQTIQAYKTLFTSALAFGVRNSLLSETNCKDLCKNIEQYKNQLVELNKQIDELKSQNIKLERKLKEQEKSNEKKLHDEMQLHKQIVIDLKKQLEQLALKPSIKH